MKYNNQEDPHSLIKINGNRDKTFPTKYVKSNLVIEGTHLMVFNQAATISKLLNYLIETSNDEWRYETIPFRDAF